MIRPSDKGPGRVRPPRMKQGRGGGGTPPSGGGKKPGCWIVAVPAVALLAVCAGLLIHAP